MGVTRATMLPWNIRNRPENASGKGAWYLRLPPMTSCVDARGRRHLEKNQRIFIAVLLALF
jgi:hypothetical protein